MGLCVEPEIARNRDLVLDRISGTVDLNRACIRGARERGTLDRLMPVLQGWMLEDYVRCLERMPNLPGFPIVVVGSSADGTSTGFRAFCRSLRPWIVN